VYGTLQTAGPIGRAV